MFFSPLSICIHANRIIEFETQKNANAGNQDAGKLKDVIDIQAIQSPVSLKADQTRYLYFCFCILDGWPLFITFQLSNLHDLPVKGNWVKKKKRNEIVVILIQMSWKVLEKQ